MRTLLNKNGSTDVEATTGVLDTTATPPGSISKLQFKAFRADETVGYTRNYNSLTGGYQHFSFSNMVRGQAIQTQGSIKAIDGKRTDIVTVTGNVLERPDLEVSLAAPGNAYPNRVVDITATVGEKNGDVAATTDCVLYVDGVEVDRANGVFVDAGSLVTCAFTTQFQVLGTHALKVTAANVVPADWDTANNSATGSIEIVSPSVHVASYVGFYDQAYGYSAASHGNYRYSDGTYGQNQDWSNENGYSQRSQALYVEGVSQTQNQSAFMEWPLTISGTLTSGSFTANLSSGLMQTPDYSYNDGYYRSECARRYDDSTGTYLYACNYGYGGYSQSYFVIEHYAGEYTYFSRGHNYWWDSNGGSSTYDYDYVSNYWQYGSIVADLGAGMTGTATVDAANGSFTASGSCTAQVYDYGYTQPESCYDYTDAYATQHYCSSYQQINRQAYCNSYTP